MYDFDQVIDRSHSDSVKWRTYPPDVLPLWVADMDFQAPPPVLAVLQRAAAYGVLGYGSHYGEQALLEAWQERLAAKYNWAVEPVDLMLIPGVVTAANLACRALGAPGDQALVPAPVYGPLLTAPSRGQLACVPVPLTCDQLGQACPDMQALEQAVTPGTRILILCNPHNPVGRVYTRTELESLADFALRHKLIIVSDEIHCDFIYPGGQHIPIAATSPEIAARTVTLMAPSKTFNMPGLHSSVAIVTNPALRARLSTAMDGIVPGIDPLAKEATVAALREGQPWLDELLIYLQANRDFLAETVHSQLPGIHLVTPQGTYLAWLDCREAQLDQPAYKFFLDKARVALSNGCSFGEGNEPFVRLNFGCPRSILTAALERMVTAWHQR
ncbi:MAG: MalY/PatB family protein [Anaerolineae bacterium]